MFDVKRPTIHLVHGPNHVVLYVNRQKIVESRYSLDPEQVLDALDLSYQSVDADPEEYRHGDYPDDIRNLKGDWAFL